MQKESLFAENRLKQGGNTSAISHQPLQKHFGVSIQSLRWFIFVRDPPFKFPSLLLQTQVAT